MEFLKSEMLCACLTEDQYDRLNLQTSNYSEFFLKEMVKILPLPGMERWPMTNRQDSQLLFSLVCIDPHDRDTPTQGSFLKWAAKAKKAALKLLLSSFELAADHEAITSTVNNFPTMGIFMCRVDKKRRDKVKNKSIFDYKDTSCLASVTYFRHGQQTQLLWLATTLQKPPIQSVHAVWRKMGLGTYLVCLLIKQHQGIPPGSLEDSVLCLQASTERTNPSRSFYLKLGFICHDLEDNGLSLTSEEFKKTVIDFPSAWVLPENQKMALFKLMHGRLTLSETALDVIDLTTTSELASPNSWKEYVYAKFPLVLPSMMRIESYVDICPVLKWLSTERLPETDRPFVPTRSLSTTSGKILGHARAWFESDTWLKTDDIQFLVAFLMRNKLSNNGFVHVLMTVLLWSIKKPSSSLVAGVCQSAWLWETENLFLFQWGPVDHQRCQSFLP